MFQWLLQEVFAHAMAHAIDSASPDPSKLKIDFADPESLLYAAAILDHFGEWDRAMELYRYVLQEWPDEHGVYARNSLSAIERKIAQIPGAQGKSINT